MLRYLLAVLLVISFEEGRGQKLLVGVVTDSVTREALPLVNVYVNNSTIGTSTDSNGEFSLQLPDRQVDIVISFLGYRSKNLSSLAFKEPKTKADVRLAPSSNQLQSITIQASQDTEWKRLIGNFNEIFLGKSRMARECTILNPEYIDLKNEKIGRQRILSAQASRPIEVRNNALGYTIRYDLKNFSSSKGGDRFAGNVYFIPLKETDSKEKERWRQNRLDVYQGSVRHLFKSILDRDWVKEGFSLFAVEKINASTQNTNAFEPKISKGRVPGTFRVYMAHDVQIEYWTLIGRITFANSYVDVDGLGVPIDPLTISTSGYLSNDRISSLLPYDYVPGDITEKKSTVDNSFRSALTPSDHLTALIVLDSLKQRSLQFSESHRREKVYVQFDKPFYFVGEDSWYKAYVVKESDLGPTNISSVLYMDWISPEGSVVKHQKLNIENGQAVGDMNIDASFHTGNYTVRAYTNWMRNDDPDLFYYRKLQVIGSAPDQIKDTGPYPPKIDLQFFPEGGTFVESIQARMAFKATDSHGRGIDVKGKILDEHGNVVCAFQSLHNGIGIFPIEPGQGKSYKAILAGGEVYPLPVPTSNGITLSASNSNNDKIVVRVKASNKVISPNMYLIAHSRGSVCYASYIKMDSISKDISIRKDSLPEGVLQLTLFDKNGLPQCERMLFIQKNENMQLTISSDKDEYLPRDSIQVTLQLKDNQGKPVKTLLSVSVTDGDIAPANSHSENIYTTLLLQSDLKGTVENPNWYFESDSPQTSYALDLVMLSHGWSTYHWQDILARPSESNSFVPENGLTIKGNIISHNNAAASNVTFVLSVPGVGKDNFNIHQTDSLGNFNLTGNDFYGDAILSWRVMAGKKGAVENATVAVDTIQNIAPVHLSESRHSDAPSIHGESLSKLVALKAKKYLMNLDSAKVLDEVVVSASSIKIKNVGAGSVVITPGPEDRRASTAQFISRYALGITSARMVGYWGEEKWITKPGAPIVITVNGVMANNVGPHANPYVVLNAIAMETIEFVIVTGSAHKGYFINVGTKEPNLPTIKQLIKVKGYDMARDFYHPKYGPSDPIAGAPDHRITLYWNADVQTNEEGVAVVKFYNSDDTKRIQVVAEGIREGQPVSGVSLIKK